MKKLFSIIMIFVLALSITACGKKNQVNEDDEINEKARKKYTEQIQTLIRRNMEEDKAASYYGGESFSLSKFKVDMLNKYTYAIKDINADNIDELIVKYHSSDSYDFYIYEYDSKNKEVKKTEEFYLSSDISEIDYNKKTKSYCATMINTNSLLSLSPNSKDNSQDIIGCKNGSYYDIYIFSDNDLVNFYTIYKSLSLYLKSTVQYNEKYKKANLEKYSGEDFFKLSEEEQLEVINKYTSLATNMRFSSFSDFNDYTTMIYEISESIKNFEIDKLDDLKSDILRTGELDFIGIKDLWPVDLDSNTNSSNSNSNNSSNSKLNCSSTDVDYLINKVMNGSKIDAYTFTEDLKVTATEGMQYYNQEYPYFTQYTISCGSYSKTVRVGHK